MGGRVTNEYVPDEVTHPGATLEDLLEEKGMSQVGLALRTSLSKKTVNEIIRKKAAVSPETALQLERALGVAASFWNNRQRQYKEWIVSQKEKARLKKGLDFLRRLPIKEMIEFRYGIEPSSDKIELLRRALNFFGVASVDLLEKQLGAAVVHYRKSTAFAADDFALHAWLRQGQRMAGSISCAPYDRTRFRNALESIRQLTPETPDVFAPKLQEVCAQCGVAVVFVPELPRTRAFGATHWQAGRPVIQLSLRGKKDDVLWFTFFHEAGHVYLHEKRRSVYLDVEKKEGIEEIEANEFASEILIRGADLKRFVDSHCRISYAAIQSFAAEQGVAPSIVVGQLQHFKYVPPSHFNRLRRTLRWG